MGTTQPRRSRRSQHDQQLILPFSAPEPLRVALRSIDRRVAGVKSDRRMRQCCELAIAIWWCGQNDGCRAHVRRLIEIANANGDPDKPIIGTRRQFFDVLKTLRDMGLVTSDPRWDMNAKGNCGRAPSERVLDEERILELRAQSRELAEAEKSHSRRTFAAPSPHLRRTHALLSETSEALETNKTGRSSSSGESHGTTPRETPNGEEEEILSLVQKARTKIAHAPIKLEEAVRNAFGRGCTIEQLRERVAWFANRQLNWDERRRPGALFSGINNALPGLPVDQGWPTPQRSLPPHPPHGATT